jgi:hypothetical protein
MKTWSRVRRTWTLEHFLSSGFVGKGGRTLLLQIAYNSNLKAGDSLRYSAIRLKHKTFESSNEKQPAASQISNDPVTFRVTHNRSAE